MPNADEAKGRIKEAAGSLAGDEELKREGQADQAAGKAQRAVQGIADRIKGVFRAR